MAWATSRRVQSPRLGDRGVLPLALRLGESGGVGRRRVAVQRLAHDARPVEGHAHGLAHGRVVEGRSSRVELEERGLPEVRVPVEVARGVLGHPALLDVVHEERRPVQLSGLEGAQDLRVRVIERHPEGRDPELVLLPVLRIPAQLVDVGLEATHLREGPGAHRARVVEGRGLGHVLPLVLGDDGLGADGEKPRRVGALERELDARPVGALDVGEESPHPRAVEGGEAPHQVEGEGHVLPRERLAVGPEDPGADREPDGEVAGAPLVARGQPGQVGPRGAAVDEKRLVDARGGRPPRVGVVAEGVEGALPLAAPGAGVGDESRSARAGARFLPRAVGGGRGEGARKAREKEEVAGTAVRGRQVASSLSWRTRPGRPHPPEATYVTGMLLHVNLTREPTRVSVGRPWGRHEALG